jgi:hypothetical protein
MIVRTLDDGRLLCINQTTHALLAAAFCRYWGNHEFARPDPYAPVLLAIAQHDNGWYEWEQRPRLRSDGYPMDFLHDDDPLAKLALWTRGIDRVAAQHPYAGLLVGNHAALLYAGSPPNRMSGAVQAATSAFIEEQQRRAERARTLWCSEPEAIAWLNDERVAANTRLLQFGDNASLQVCMPWPSPGVLRVCPVDNAGAYTAIAMEYDDKIITFDPWPFDVGEFEVAVHGRVLEQTQFSDESSYQRALADAPQHQLRWRVARNH